MRLFKLMHYEIRRTISDNTVAIIGCFCFVIVIGFAFLGKVNLGSSGSWEKGDSLGSFSAGDIIVFANCGMKPFDPLTRKFFVLDMVWAMPYLLLGYLSCSAFSKEVKEQALQIIPRIQSRIQWIISKYFRNMLLAFVFMLFEFLFSALLCVALNESPSLMPTGWSSLICNITYQNISINSIALVYLEIVLVMIISTMLITTLTLILGSAFSYLFLIFYVVASAYFSVPFLFLENSMIVRSVLVSGDWFVVPFNFAVYVVYVSFSVTLGFLKARKIEFQ